MIVDYKNHPECQEGELFLRNVITSGSMELKEFELIRKDFASARLGLHAYDEKCNLVVGNRPVFVKLEEMVSRMSITPWEEKIWMILEK